MKTIQFHVLVGGDIDDSARAASKIARDQGCRVRFEFNGMHLYATPKKSPVTISWEYSFNLRNNYATGQEIERGRRDSLERADALQKWLSILPSVIESGLDNLIGWMATYIRIADGNPLQYDRLALAKRFEDAGYKDREYAAVDRSKRDPELHLVKEKLGRYIMGQVIACLKSDTAPHQRLEDFCGDYDRLREQQIASQNQKN